LVAEILKKKKKRKEKKRNHSAALVLANLNNIAWALVICSFIWQGTSTRRRRSELFRFLSSQAATCYYQSDHSKAEAILLSTLSKDRKSKLAH